MFKKTILAASILCAMAGSAQAFTVDVNGGAAGGTVNGVTTLDWLPGNALAVGGNPTGGLQTGDTVTLLYQANLGTLTDGNNILYTNGGSGSHITAVAGFNETATVTNGGLNATFVDAGGTNFFRIYASGANGNNLAGTGFTTGTLILAGTLQSVQSSNFTATTATPVQFDQFPQNNAASNNYPGTTTIVGSGSTDLTWLINFFDPAFFPSFNIGDVITTAINSSLVDPFRQVDPSRAFSSNGIANGDLPSNIGTCNGCFHATGSDLNFQFQADANSSITVTVPEPGTLALIGAALGGLGFMNRRRRVEPA
jgi:hypothetical protein